MKRFVNGLSTLVRRAPLVVVAVAVTLTAMFGYLATQVEMVTGNEGFAPDNAELAASETIAEEFGDSSESIVQILLKGPNVISADGLGVVDDLTASLQADLGASLSEQPGRPGVVSFLAPVQQVIAQQQIPPEAIDDEFVAQTLSESLEQIPEAEAGVVEGLLPDNADLADASADAGLVLVFLDTSDVRGQAGFDRLIEMEGSVAQAVASLDLPPGYSAEPFSFALLFGEQDEFMNEVSRLFAAAFAIILVILSFVYWVRPSGRMTRARSARRAAADVAMTMTAIVMAILWMQGSAALLGPGYLGVIGGLTEVTQIIPVLLIGLGVDYAIHMTSRYREEIGSGAAVDEAVGRAVHTVGIALVLATLTTAVGFLTNIVNPVPALVDFGVLAAVGIVASFVLMLTFVPAVRVLLDSRAQTGGRLPTAELGGTGERLLPGIMARTAVLAEKAPIPTLLVTVVLGGALGGWGLANLETRFSTTDFVASDSPIVQTLDEIIERFGGGFGENTDVLLSGDFATPAAHNALVQAHADLAAVDDVAAAGGQAQASSPVTVLGQLIAPGPGGAPPMNPKLASEAGRLGVQPDLRVAPDTDVPALYQRLLDAAPQLAAGVLATDDAGDIAYGRVNIRTTAGEARAGELREALDSVFAPVEAAGADAVATSNQIISDVIVNALSNSQVSSLAVTLVVAMLLLVVTFWFESRKPFLGVITIAPVALVVLWTFGMMAATGIPFGPVTATIAALAIGIGVPYTIHITHRFQEDRARHDSLEEAIRSTVRFTGGALAGSAFTTMAGFGILITSSLTPFQQFGLVTVYAIGFALLAATLVLPSMLALWDTWHRRRGHTTALDPDLGLPEGSPPRAQAPSSATGSTQIG